jgi:hypothetical protein
MSDLQQMLVRVTEEARQIADEGMKAGGFRSLSEYVEWLLLCQRYSAKEAAERFADRNVWGGNRGQR